MHRSNKGFGASHNCQEDFPGFVHLQVGGHPSSGALYGKERRQLQKADKWGLAEK